VYSASFAEDRDIATPAVVAQCLAGLVDDPQQTLRDAEAPAVKAQLRSHGERANELGIFGSPSFVVGDELFWGNDRLENALYWATRATSPHPLERGSTQARVPSATKT
jgi:2-hydroxychromene-2-carboxylate isomerase